MCLPTQTEHKDSIKHPCTQHRGKCTKHTHTRTHTCSYTITKYVSCTHNDGAQTKTHPHSLTSAKRSALCACFILKRLIFCWILLSFTSCCSVAHSQCRYELTHTHTNGHTGSLRWETLNDTLYAASRVTAEATGCDHRLQMWSLSLLRTESGWSCDLADERLSIEWE